ncbi:MAG TPA: hypothetical protein VH413_13660 [Verrucomicrobiae bacterium]|jgi:hypothetical protein|nr:hypothetical protein [Verrucomicrobiae bacterium]
MNPFWLNHIVSACPLKIEHVQWHDPQLTIGGSSWGFNTIVPWRLIDAKKMIVGSDDEGFENAIKTLVGIQIIDCTTHERCKNDPCFVLSNGHQLEFFSTTTLEPWTMKLPKPPILVASPGDPKWAN